MSKDPAIFLNHILDCIELIEKRTKGVSYEQFQKDIDLQDMVVRRLEIIGEAVRNLSQEYRQQHATINWQDPAGMRSALIHNYYEVDLSIVWDTIVNDLPNFKKQVKELV